MTPKEHREQIVLAFKTQFRDKYDKGQKEHGGHLWEAGPQDLVGKAIEEVLDQAAYLYTLQYALTRNPYRIDVWQAGLRASVFADLEREIVRILTTKRPLDQHTDAGKLAVLVEEVGEVATALLKSDCHPCPLYDELKQVAAFAMCWMSNLQDRQSKVAG